MNTKTTLFIVLLVLAHFLVISDTSRIQSKAKFQSNLKVASKSKTISNIKIKAQAKATATSKTKTQVTRTMCVGDKGQVVDITSNRFILRNPITLEPFNKLLNFKFTLTDSNKKEYTGTYNGSSIVVFKDLKNDQYNIHVTTDSTIEYQQSITIDSKELEHPVYLVPLLGDNQWLAILTWKKGAKLFNSAEVGENHYWTDGLTEQQKLVRNNFGPQVVQFEIIKDVKNKDYALYEVYYAPGFKNNVDTGAHVVVYNGRKLIGIYNVPQVPAKYEGIDTAKLWHVFEIVAKNGYSESNEISSHTSFPNWFLHK